MKDYPLVRFDQIAEMISERIDPAEAEVERYVGLEHLDPETLQIKRWGCRWLDNIEWSILYSHLRSTFSPPLPES